VGLVTGTVAAIIDIGTSWMSDLKFGICPQAFWLNMEQCCWSSNETSFELDKGNCSQVNVLIHIKLITKMCVDFNLIYKHCILYVFSKTYKIVFKNVKTFIK